MVSATDFAAFAALLQEGEALFDGVQRRLADALGINATRYSKLRTGTAYTLNVGNCLRLAAILQRSPAEVLRAAGKPDIADLLDGYYGRPQYAPLPGGAQGREMAKEWGRLSETQRALVLQLAAALPPAAAVPSSGDAGSAPETSAPPQTPHTPARRPASPARTGESIGKAV